MTFEDWVIAGVLCGGFWMGLGVAVCLKYARYIQEKSDYGNKNRFFYEVAPLIWPYVWWKARK